MRNISYKLFLIFLAGIIFAQNQSPYLDIANELLVRKKLAKKLPDVFDNAKYSEVVDKIDAIAKISPKDHDTRMAVINPEFHWCFSQTYLLANKSAKAIDHYRKYKIQSLNNTTPTHALFQKNINELEIALENNQAILAQEIFVTITDFKNTVDSPTNIQIQQLQDNLNTFNELNNNAQIISEDGTMGPQTKSAIYDFEENNPYFVSQSEIQSSLVKSVEISSAPTPIQSVSSSSQLDAEQIAGDNSIHLSTKIIVSEDKIKSIPGTSIAEVLENVLGINIKRQGASDVLANISTFGGTGEQTLILVDGLKISNQQTLHHDLDLPINIDDIKQIEVYRNAAARAYGTGAISGVVNIITKSGKERKTYLAAEFGDYSLVNSNLMVTVPIGKSFHNLSFNSLSSEGYKTNTDFLKNTFYYKYSLQDGKTSTNFSFGYLSRGNGITNQLENVYENQYEKNSTKFFNSKILWNFGKVKLESNTHWFDHQDELAKDKDTGHISADRGSDEGENRKKRKGLEKDLKKKGIGYKKTTGKYKYDDGSDASEVSYSTTKPEGMSKRKKLI